MPYYKFKTLFVNQSIFAIKITFKNLKKVVMLINPNTLHFNFAIVILTIFFYL